MLTCEFCQKEYSTKGNLSYHVKTNKKCILLRGETVESKDLFNCEYCDFKTLNKSVFKSHSCKNKIEFEVKQENSDLKAENKKMDEKENELIYKRFVLNFKYKKICQSKLTNNYY